MTFALVFLSALMAVVVGWLVRQSLRSKPWAAAHPDAMHGESTLSMPPVKVGLWVFMAVATSLFALFISAYHMRMVSADWIGVPMPKVLWLNTLVLVLASVAMQWTRNSAARGEVESVRSGLVAAGALSITFIAGQLWAWRQLEVTGHYLAGNPANAFFFVLTALHGLHLLGGLYVWARTTRRAWQGNEPGDVRLSVELCATYWHFLLLVWVALFVVLLNTHP